MHLIVLSICYEQTAQYSDLKGAIDGHLEHDACCTEHGFNWHASRTDGKIDLSHFGQNWKVCRVSRTPVQAYYDPHQETSIGTNVEYLNSL